MGTNLEKHKERLKYLTALSEAMLINLHLERAGNGLKKEEKVLLEKAQKPFEAHYQAWYTEAHAVIRQLIPERLGEFETLYKAERVRKEIDASSFTIQDWLNGLRSAKSFAGEKFFDDLPVVTQRFNTQAQILAAAEARFESSLFDIRQVLQADLFDSELDAARELVRNGYARAAGAVAGVILEAHLTEVCTSHKVPIKKGNPGISDLNDLLKNASVMDVPTWRFIQRLGDLRNLCDHKKQRDPTKEEVEELIEGVKKISHTLM